MDRQPVRRRRFYVHGIQRKYIFLSLVPLIISAFLIVVFLFIPLDVLLYSSAAPAAKTAIVQDLRALGFRIWPAIFLGMIISAFMSVFVTHRFAGPLYRFHQVVDQMAAGDLSGQFKLRKGDDLVELEMAMNRAIESLAGTIQQAKRPLGDLTHRLETLLEEIREGSGHSLEKDLAELSQIAQEAQTALARLKVARE
ncbi:MAG: methyl-accepting chemotaxis protein [candidate division NC10 bacterium]|jgi:methyl-accepting chemotaxis protein|nr:methyl-accepting chemotaxis protein [candidate division NC10 bacterium]MCH7895431.1 methyl-accepting chemotaxis protein [candidate division NC10 bacterium]MCZ6551008.1 methyl-accepting chemotaxis protein [candidate division NC10 bacterium]